MKKVVIYARVSSEKQEKEQTIKYQLEKLRDACKEFQIVDEYIDEGWSGEILARPQLDRLREDAPKGLFEAIYVLCPDRLARKYAYQCLILDELQKRGVGVEFLNHKIEDNPEDNLLLQIQGAVAEYEKTKILERFRMGKIGKAKRGLVVGTYQPYGYNYIKKTPENNGYYEINKEEAIVVRLIFKMYLKYQSIIMVAKKLTEQGVYSPRKKGRFWRPSTINTILKNETYIGLTYFNKHKSIEPIKRAKENGKYVKRLKTSSVIRDKSEWILIHVPAIIDEKIFSLTQDLLAKNHFPYGKAKHEYLLSSLLECSCGGRYGGNHNAGYVYYRCSSRKGNPFSSRECSAKLVRSTIMDNTIWLAVYNAITHPKTLLGFLEFVSGKIGNVDKTNKEIKELEKQLKQDNCGRDKLIDLYQSGIISKEDLANKIEAKNKLIVEIKNEIGQKQGLIAQTKNVSITKEFMVRFCKMAQGKLKNLNFEQKRLFLRTILDKVIYDYSQKSAKIIGEIPLYKESSNEIQDWSSLWTGSKEYLYGRWF